MVMSTSQSEICGLCGILEINVGSNRENCKDKENGAKASSSPVRSRQRTGPHPCDLNTHCSNEHALHLMLLFFLSDVLDMFLPNIEYSVNQTLAKRTKY